jgi:hypothetical protein
VLLGNNIRRSNSFRLQGCYLLWPYFPESSANYWFCNSLIGLAPDQMCPTTPLWQRRKALAPQWFGLIPVRSPLLRDSLFTFSSSGYLDVSIHPVPSTGPMYSDLGTSALPLVGFPIRTPPDQWMFGSFPGIFAAYRVLRRLLAPRHPPYALISLVLMLALAMEFPRFWVGSENETSVFPQVIPGQKNSRRLNLRRASQAQRFSPSDYPENSLRMKSPFLVRTAWAFYGPPPS